MYIKFWKNEDSDGIKVFNLVLKKQRKWVLKMCGNCLFFAETFRSSLAETFWSLRHFGHLSHSCIKTHRNTVD